MAAQDFRDSGRINQVFEVKQKNQAARFLSPKQVRNQFLDEHFPRRSTLPEKNYSPPPARPTNRLHQEPAAHGRHGCGQSGPTRVVWRRQDPQTMEQHSTCDVVTFLGSLLRFIGVESRHKRTANWSERLGFGIMQHQDLHQKLPPLPRQERSCCRKS